MSNKLTPMIIEVTPVKEHIMRLRIRHSLGVISLVSVYTLTEVSDLTMKDAFYATLESVVHQCPSGDTCSLGGFSLHRLELKWMVTRHVLVPMGLEL